MLETYFKYPGVLRRMRQGPLAGLVDQVASDLERTGYSSGSAKRYLSLVATFSRYAAEAGCSSPQLIKRRLVERFLDQLPRSESTISLARSAMGHVLRHLGSRYPSSDTRSSPGGPDASLLVDFDTHLRDVRGLESRSREGVLLEARRVLEWCRKAKPRRSLSRLRPEDILALASQVAARCVSDSTRSSAMSNIRNFLRYLRWAGVLRGDLARHVPRVPIWRRARIPDHLEWEDVRRVVNAIDATDPVGKRDRALLLLLATTGMRGGELRRLELKDIRWRQGELHLRQTKSRRDRVVPLLNDAGGALAEYILRGRPRITESRVFLSRHPPFRPLQASSAVSAIVRRHLERSGIRRPRAGSHLLRHSLATHLVRQARPIKEIADLLGHQHIDTTAVYVKVALPQLTEVALPFPGGKA
jgi:site-specific recombinase XerD